MPRFSKKIVGTVDTTGDGGNAYEAERAARIEENKRRMLSLGILQSAKTLADAANAERAAARNARADAAAANGGYKRRIERPAVKRRSGRLSGAAPKDYSPEIDPSGTNRDLWEPTYNEERYTVAHKEALGTSTKAWTLFVDGYDAKGNRIYDPVRGATCHQCRQKTVCRHTSCGGCGELRGQFCGDCLWMRYGENVDEANAAGGTWRCPSCRDLCNCSFCRTRKGLPPTGTLYRRAVKEGFASVAHYLVLNNMADEENDGGGSEDGGELPRARPGHPGEGYRAREGAFHHPRRLALQEGEAHRGLLRRRASSPDPREAQGTEEEVRLRVRAQEVEARRVGVRRRGGIRRGIGGAGRRGRTEVRQDPRNPGLQDDVSVKRFALLARRMLTAMRTTFSKHPLRSPRTSREDPPAPGRSP